MTSTKVPHYQDLLWPVLTALGDLGGSGAIGEIVERVLTREQYSEGQQAVLHGDGPSTELEYRMAWARTCLKGMGLAVNSKGAVWSLTEAGREIVETDIEPLRQEYLQRMRQRRAERAESLSPTPDQSSEVEPYELTWQEQLLDILMSMTPDGFERLAQRLLREAGFKSVQVTGRSGDGGIDGLGVYRVSLLSFQVFFQCKRYRGSVPSKEVRDFRGAMQGRGDKGLLITTGTFTRDAKTESTRDGAPPIDLIDGRALCDLLRQYELGLTVTPRVEEDITLDPGFFAEL